MDQHTLSYWRSAALWLTGRVSSKAVQLIDRFIKEHGENALVKKTSAEMTSLIMNIDYTGFGVLDEELL